MSDINYNLIDRYLVLCDMLNLMNGEFERDVCSLLVLMLTTPAPLPRQAKKCSIDHN